MNTSDIGPVLTQLFSELANGPTAEGDAYILNSGDHGLLASLDRLSAADATRSVHEGGTIAGHAQHVRYGLSLMNRWAREGGNPFADAKWDEAWKTSVVDDARWMEIREGLRGEVHRWIEVLRTPRDVGHAEIAGMVASIAHLAYHVGAIRQISKDARGPTEGTY